MQQKPNQQSSFSEVCKKNIQKVNQYLGVSGWISVSTLILVIIILASFHEHRQERFGRGCGGRQTMERGFGSRDQRGLENKISDRNDFFDEIDNHIQKIQNQGEQMFRQQESMINSFDTNDNQLKNGANQYNVSIKDGSINGSYSSQDASGIQALIPQIQSLGLQVEQKNNTILFQGKLDDTNKLLQFLK